MESKNSTKSIVEAGLMAALVVVLMFLNAYVPVIGYIGMMILPLPITLLVVRHNVKVALGAVIASSIIIAFIMSPISAIASLLLYGLVGLTLGFCIKSKKSPVFSVAAQGIAIITGTVASIALTIYVMMNTTLYKFIEGMVDTMKESMNAAMSIYTSMGIDPSSNPFVKSMEMLNVETLILMIPGVIIIYAFFMAYINYIITRSIFKKMKIYMENFPPFARWYLDNRITALVIIIACIGIILASMGVNIGQNIYIGSIYLLQMVFLIIGISAVTYMLRERFNVPKGLVIVIIAFTITGFERFYAMIGLVDSIMDLRRIDPHSLRNAIEKRFAKK
ncbi:YybS family protein [Clostridium polynesiense]|uniref:YybS family protein n=1 Tax=Clostridium polynesiense TaxID=1325933 RepID=UPI00058BA661|nr:DUF2232 domain-containing protein [Clostridium polynesiense]